MTAQTKSAFCREPLAKGIDVLAEPVQTLHKKLLNLLLLDHTTKRRILWATRDYVSNGPEFDEFCEMLPELVTGKYATIIQPRITKTLNEQQGRTRTRAEVFTPAWICNRQNNLVDAAIPGQSPRNRFLLQVRAKVGRNMLMRNGWRSPAGKLPIWSADMILLQANGFPFPAGLAYWTGKCGL